jgi:hypothetical protein
MRRRRRAIEIASWCWLWPHQAHAIIHWLALMIRTVLVLASVLLGRITKRIHRA